VQGAFATNGDEFFHLRPQYESSWEAESDTITLRGGIRYLLNPGSVGQPRDGDWRAAFGVYDEGRAEFTWHRAPYSVMEAQRRIRSAGLPENLAARLQKGL
jgi:diadenosine tetraphosphatase ApaH/serine/threonine PP2A family protein phosphatase